MSDIFIEAFSGELSKVASRRIMRSALKRVRKLGKKARRQAAVGAGLKGATKLGEDVTADYKTPDLKRLESQAKTMESKMPAKPPKPATPPPSLGVNGKAKPMPSKGTKAVELAKTSSAGMAMGRILMGKIAEGPAAVPPLSTVPPPNTMEQKTTGQTIKPPAKPKPLPMPSTGPALTPMGKAAEDAGKMVKALLEETEKEPAPYTDGQQMGVDDPRYGGGPGLKNLKGKAAPKFTDRFNPTDVPQAFGKR